jgi:hypothetical protein
MELTLNKSGEKNGETRPGFKSKTLKKWLNKAFLLPIYASIW